MLIVCPSCATSYMIDPASVGPAGRTVRCARCRATWFVGGPKAASDVTAFVDSVIAEAEARTGGPRGSLPKAANLATAPDEASHTGDDFGEDQTEPVAEPPPAMAEPSPAVEPYAGGSDFALPEQQVPEPPAIADAPSLVPPIEHAPLPGAHAEVEPEDIETFAARRKRLQARRQKSRKSSRWTAIVLVLFAFNVALVGARNEVVRFLPQTASLFAAIGLPVNLRNLKFENVRISKEADGGMTSLIVEGSIVSTANKPTEVPRLRFSARNPSGQEIYTWTAKPERSILEPGESLEFSSRLASPPPEASDVMVRFFNAQDAAAGAK
jgi:predicted Zn finger-like uncharacterized protein